MTKKEISSLRRALVKISADLLPLESLVEGFAPPYSYEQMTIIQDVDHIAMYVADAMSILDEMEED